MAAAGDQQVLDLLRHDRAIRDVVRFRLNLLRFEIVRTADRRLVGMQIEIPAAGRDDVIEAAATVAVACMNRRRV